MILLTSDGLTSYKINNLVRDIVEKNNFKKAVFITSAVPSDKVDPKEIDKFRKQLEEHNLSVEIFDYGVNDNSILENMDVIFLGGGNPFLLLKKMKEHHAKGFLTDFLAKGKLLMGLSAGALVLQGNLNLIDEVDVEENENQLDSLEALNFVDFETFPHYQYFSSVNKNLENQVQNYEKKTGIRVYRLADGEAIFIDNGKIIELLKN